MKTSEKEEGRRTEFDFAGVVEQNVGRLDIEVEDAALVDVGEAFERVLEDVGDLASREERDKPQLHKIVFFNCQEVIRIRGTNRIVSHPDSQSDD